MALARIWNCPSMAYELLIFDFDGTLVDTAPDIALHANAVLEENDFPKKNLKQIKKAIGRGVHELLRDLGFKGDEAFLDKAVLDFKKKYSKKPVIQTAPYPYVRENLQGPLKTIKKAIVTNKPHALTMKILKKLGLDGYFDLIIGEGGKFPRKPDPASVRFVMRKLKISPKRTAFVGDSRIDRDTAKNAGIKFVHVSYGYDAAFRPKRSSIKSAASWPQILKPKGSA